MIKSLKKLINKTVYENAAEYPWAKFKDFILSEDGRCVEKVLIISESLIPVPYTVRVCDFETIGDKKAMLKPDVKPVACRVDKANPYSVSNLKKYRFEKEGQRRKIFDVSFDTEAGEIIDFIITPSPIGKKAFLSPGNEEFDKLISLYLKNCHEA